MPYKDPSAQREYQRKWCAERRANALEGKACVDCGCTQNLEMDHVDPTTKVDHRMWSWTQPRLAAEIAKCVTRCRACHQERHAALRRKHGQGGYKRGCRCVVCREANREKARRYYAKKRALSLVEDDGQFVLDLERAA